MRYCMYTHPWLWSIPTIFLIYLPPEYLPPAVVLWTHPECLVVW